MNFHTKVRKFNGSLRILRLLHKEKVNLSIHLPNLMRTVLILFIVLPVIFLHCQEYRNCDHQRGSSVKIEILEFEGKIHPDNFLDWLHAVERIFDFLEALEERKAKHVVVEVRKGASMWWEKTNSLRLRNSEVGWRHGRKWRRNSRNNFCPLSRILFLSFLISSKKRWHWKDNKRKQEQVRVLAPMNASGTMAIHTLLYEKMYGEVYEKSTLSGWL